MLTLYTLCAVGGSVLLVLQFVLSLSGFGDTDVDMAEDFDIRGGAHHDSTWFFGILSLKSLVAAIAFFGLGGRLLEALEAGAVLSFFGALAAAAIAMVVVAWLMRLLVSLKHDGTVRIEGAVGLPARVYLAVPAQNTGVGKVMLQLQGRTVEYQAITNGDALPSNSNAVVVGVVDDMTLEVISGATET